MVLVMVRGDGVQCAGIRGMQKTAKDHSTQENWFCQSDDKSPGNLAMPCVQAAGQAHSFIPVPNAPAPLSLHITLHSTLPPLAPDPPAAPGALPAP